MTEPLESELDRLFQLPPADMVEARNALVNQLRKAGDKAGAARVKALKRPTPTAWALNQVHFREPALLARAQDATQRFRELQARDEVQREELAAAALAQRNGVQQVIDAAVRACASAGIATGAPQERKLLTTLQAWLAGTSEAAPGRLIQDIEPTGFEAIATVGRVATTPGAATPAPTPAPTSSRPPPSAASVPPPAPVVDLKRITLAKQRFASCEEAAAATQALAEQLNQQRERARAALEDTQAGMREAEETLIRLRKQREAQLRELDTLRLAADKATTDNQRAQTALANARTELASAQAKRS